MEEKKRIAYLDQLKGLAIFLVVFAHVIAWSYADFESFKTDMGKSWLFWCIYAFHMPLFFFISGFLGVHSVTKYTKLELIKKRTFQLAVPYLAATFVVEILLQQQMNYWFLAALYLMNLAIVLSFKKNFPFFPVVAWVLIYLTTILFPVLNDIPYAYVPAFKKYFPYFLLGYYCSMYPGMKNFLCDKISRLTFFVFVCLMFFQFSGYPGVPEKLLHNEKIMDLWGYLKAFSAVVFIFFFFEKKSSSFGRVGNVLKKMGESSLAIYIVHVLFKFAIPCIGDFLAERFVCYPVMLQVVYALFFSALLSSISIVMSKLIEYDKILAALFLGKK